MDQSERLAVLIGVIAFLSWFKFLKRKFDSWKLSRNDHEESLIHEKKSKPTTVQVVNVDLKTSSHISPEKAMDDFYQTYRVKDLDAEELAELGIKKLYLEFCAEFPDLLPNPEEIIEITNEESYYISYKKSRYMVFDPVINGKSWNSWEAAASIFFLIINDQLPSDLKLYALRGGEELEGVILNRKEYDTVCRNDNLKFIRPYLLPIPLTF